MHRPMPTSGKAKSTKSTILSAEEALPPSSPAAGAVLVGYHQDPLAHLADLIIQRHIGALPDLTHCIVLLPDTLAAPRLRRHLLAAAAHHGVTALLGPQILSLRSYAMRHADGDGATLSPQARDELAEIVGQCALLQGEFGEQTAEVGREQPGIAGAEQRAVLFENFHQQQFARLR